MALRDRQLCVPEAGTVHNIELIIDMLLTPIEKFHIIQYINVEASLYTSKG